MIYEKSKSRISNVAEYVYFGNEDAPANISNTMQPEMIGGVGEAAESALMKHLEDLDELTTSLVEQLREVEKTIREVNFSSGNEGEPSGNQVEQKEEKGDPENGNI